MIKGLRIKLVAASMADATLAILQENNGTFPKREEPHEPGKPGQMPLSPELPYESRYFSVVLSSDGAIVSVDTGKIAAVDTETAAQFAQTVYQSGRTQGMLGDYRYVRHTQGEEIQVIFLDCGRSLATFRTFLLASCGISLLGLLAVFGLILLLSKRIIRPVSESYEKQKRFITDAGHEIKTPVTIIDADAAVLEMDLGENEWLRDIQQQTKRLATLTNDLILLSRMQEDRSQLAMIQLPFSDLVQETAQGFQTLAKTQGKTLVLQIQPMLSLCGDEKMLRQLVSILLDNAVKYALPQGDITLTLQKQARTICLAVENPAENLSPEHLQRLFDRFYRGDPSRSSQTGGYGLGLSIAQAIVQAHRGKISAAAQSEGMLRIQVQLPIGG